MNINTVIFQGNLTKDPETRDIGRGQSSVVGFTLANNRKFKGNDGQLREEVTFIDVEAWGRTGELVAQYLTKGSPCLVEGRLKLDQWDDKDGNKRSRVKIVAEQVHFLGGRREGGEGGERAPRPQRPAPATGGGSSGEGDPPFARSELEVMP